MFNVGTGEFVLILVIALIVLGPDRLPTAARQAGKYLAEFRRISNGFQQEFRKAVDSATDESSSLYKDFDLSGLKLPDLNLPDLRSEPFPFSDRDVQIAPEEADASSTPQESRVNLDKPAPAHPQDPTPSTGHVAVDGPSSSVS
jgi:Tat protein translocase TatB subunit